MRASERAGFKEAIPTAYFSYVEGLMMRKMVRYHAHIKNKQTARNNSLLIFLRF